MRLSVAAVFLGAALLQVTTGARVTRGLVGSGYGSSSGGGACKFWCDRGGTYVCCQTPQQTALLGGGGHLPQTSGGYGNQGFGQQFQNTGGYGSQGFGHQSQVSGGYGSQGVSSFGNNLGHHGGSFAHQGNSFGSQGGYGSQATHGSRPTVTQVIVVRPVQATSQGSYGSSQGISQGGFRPTHGVSQGGYGSSQGVSNGGFRPIQGGSHGGFTSTQHTQGVSQGGYGSTSNTHHRPQTNSRPQGHSSNFVSHPSIVTPLGQYDAVSTVGNNNNNNNYNDADSFAFQGTNQGPTHPFDLRIKPNKSQG